MVDINNKILYLYMIINIKKGMIKMAKEKFNLTKEGLELVDKLN